MKFIPSKKQLDNYIQDIENKLTELWISYQLAEKQSTIILSDSNIDWNRIKKELRIQINGLEDKVIFIKSLYVKT